MRGRHNATALLKRVVASYSWTYAPVLARIKATLLKPTGQGIRLTPFNGFYPGLNERMP